MADWNLLIGVGIGLSLPAVAVILWTLFGLFLRVTAKASAWSWHKVGSNSPQSVRAKSASVVYAGARVRMFSSANFAVLFVAGQDRGERREAEAALVKKRSIKRVVSSPGERP